MASTLTTDKSLYAPGDTITATITRAPKAVTLNGAAGSDVLSVVVNVKQSTSLSDDGGRHYTLVSDDGTSAVYTATA